ncbi:mucin-5AC isoform X2 [Brachypodium distachyon]|uniref:mucin-5AC isoform X2 n=1 Tax=Brachypodium distachyon TaxID=15368 RepID=UPI000D0DAF16|nr:mucin-5AC isoform X2 [Brachypodium distachyon]|eukprot:XP_024316240.1 mucin-5AC isoform X2 [Brachypodium distachyon]
MLTLGIRAIHHPFKISPQNPENPSSSSNHGARDPADEGYARVRHGRPQQLPQGVGCVHGAGEGEGDGIVTSPTSASSPPRSRARPVATAASAPSTVVPATGRAATATATPFPTAPHAESQKDKWAARFEALFDDALAAVRAERKAATNSQGTTSPTTSSRSDPSAPAAAAALVGLTSASVQPVCVDRETVTTTPTAAASAARSAPTSAPTATTPAASAWTATTELDLASLRPTTCSALCLGGDLTETKTETVSAACVMHEDVQHSVLSTSVSGARPSPMAPTALMPTTSSTSLVYPRTITVAAASTSSVLLGCFCELLCKVPLHVSLLLQPPWPSFARFYGEPHQQEARASSVVDVLAIRA